VHSSRRRRQTKESSFFSPRYTWRKVHFSRRP
jgi:hypothetical protein